MTGIIFRGIVERINHAIIITDKDGNFIFWNDSAKKILGMDDTMKERKVWQTYFKVKDMQGDAVPPQQLPIMKAAGGQDIYRERLFMQAGDEGKGTYLEVDAFPIKDDDGKIVAAAASFTDITNNVKMKEIIEELTLAFAHIKNLILTSIVKPVA